ncbi:ion channel [Desertibaculum subflavum]|uniref:ion channel n=1 Tax=Desertibaculum subflavum TaxID=2268458 RepID=UPI000E665C13
MLMGMLASTALVLATVGIHYEALRLVSALLPHLRIRPRARIIVIIIGAFAAHTVEVWLYALGFLLLDRFAGLGYLTGDTVSEFSTYLYHSTVTYSSLGYGDLVPHGALRLVSGVEALNGLVMIGWTASFTYLAMEKLWDLHPRRSHKR